MSKLGHANILQNDFFSCFFERFLKENKHVCWKGGWWQDEGEGDGRERERDVCACVCVKERESWEKERERLSEKEN